MTTKINGCGCLIVWILIAAGCATSADIDNQFLVTKEQRTQLNAVFTDVAEEASLLRRSEISAEEVEKILRTHDDDVAKILTADQFRAYDAEHRSRFANRVYRNLAPRSGPVSSGSSGYGMSSPTVDN